MNLTEAINLRQNFLCRTLAGATALDPLWTLPKLEKLQDGAITDQQAANFIQAVKARQSELDGMTIEEQCKFMAHIGCELHLQSEYMKWINLPENLYKDAPAAIKELMALTITKSTLKNLQSWIKETEDYING
jgi:hypothetical protein